MDVEAFEYEEGCADVEDDCEDIVEDEFLDCFRVIFDGAPSFYDVVDDCEVFDFKLEVE